jgi:hypothetical protein
MSVILLVAMRAGSSNFKLVFDGNKSLYLVFVGVVFLSILGLLLEQLGQQHLDCF